MILQSLVRCYEALQQAGTLEKPGWSPVKISWALELDEDGGVVSLLPMGSVNEKGKQIPVEKNLPAQVKRANGVAANFLCDNSGYVLGVDAKGKPERTRECFAACAQLHRKLLEPVDHPMARAILNFFARWRMEDAATHPAVQPNLEILLKGGNIAFAMEQDGRMRMAYEVPEIARAWDAAYARTENAEMGRCLVTGETGPIAILHPSIRGVMGAQPSGASLVSFNAPSLESYGRDEARKQGQGRNAPVGKYAAFAYGAALNFLIGKEGYHGRLGDTTLVYWAEGAEPAYSFAFSSMLDFGGPAKNTISQKELSGVVTALCQGKTVTWQNVPLHPDNRFYILGLSPNASRLSVRFFLQDSFGAFAANYHKHQRRLEIVRPPFAGESLSLWALLRETVNLNSKNKDPQPQLVGEMLRAVLTGAPYPQALFAQTELRLRAEQDVSWGKAAILKAFLLRNVVERQKDADHVYKEVLQVNLNEESTYLPYRLGRLFAVLESLQLRANPGIKATIKDRYFNSACATPALVFPTLLRLAQSHLSKLGGPGIYYDKLITELLSCVAQSYPARLTLQDQGIFQLGYYHQKQQLFTKKEDKDNG